MDFMIRIRIVISINSLILACVWILWSQMFSGDWLMILRITIGNVERRLLLGLIYWYPLAIFTYNSFEDRAFHLRVPIFRWVAWYWWQGTWSKVPIMAARVTCPIDKAMSLDIHALQRAAWTWASTLGRKTCCYGPQALHGSSPRRSSPRP